MKKIKIISDSACDLSEEDKLNLPITYIPFSVASDGKDYLKHNSEIENDVFYKTLLDNPKLRPKSACPSTGDYYELFKQYKDDDIICLCLTAKFSASYESALIASNMIKEEFPDSIITVIDTLCITVVQGLLIKNIFSMIEDKLSYDEIVANIESIKKTGRIIFTVGSLDYLKRGGRLSTFLASLISKVNIKPIINFENGEVTSTSLTMGRGKSLYKVTEKIKQIFDSEKFDLDDYDFAVGYCYDKEEGESFLKKIQDIASSINDKIKVGFAQIGAVIGVHTGPLALGLGFIKRYKMKNKD